MNDKEFYPAPKREYKVLVRCATFNHSKYIEEALNGFAMQQTNFPFVCLVMDDASTDNEQEVIKKWMKNECDMDKAEIIDISTSIVIIVPHKTNLSCTFAFYLLKQNLYGTGKKIYYLNPWREKCEYEALCEGDDYWIDPLKLQKQVDYLEANPEYTMCFANAIEHFEDNPTYKDKIFSNIEDKEYKGIEIYKKWIIPTASVLYKCEITKSTLYLDVISNRKFLYGDITLFLTCAHYGKLRGFSDVVSVYRRTNDGAVLTKSRSYELQRRYCEHTLEIPNVFGKEYKELCLKDYHRLCIQSFFNSILNIKKGIKFYFLLDSWKLSKKKTISTILHLILNKIVKLTTL